MPAIRITLALNSKQSQRCPLVFPGTTILNPAEPSSCRSLVIKTAQSKLRLKKPSRIFLAGTGKELQTEENWKSALRDDVVLLISAGEDYVGNVKEPPPTQEGDVPDPQSLSLNAPVHILANNAYIDPLSLTQVKTTASTLPGIIHVVAQPDLHPGTKFPIGAVFVSEGWIHPPLIGGDIGCGMAWYKTKLSASQVEGDKGRRVGERLRGLEGPWRTQKDRTAWLTDIGAAHGLSGSCASAGEEWDSALGTIGAGNHFAEIQVVEEVRPGSWQDANNKRPQAMLNENEVLLLVHSGSRGYGGDILKRYTANDKTSMRVSDPKATEYLTEHDRACKWASRNRDLIALRFLACLEPGDNEWELGINGFEGDVQEEVVWEALRNVQSRKVVDICHNNVESTLWPPFSPSTSKSSTQTGSESIPREAYIHRKGAAPISVPSPLRNSASTLDPRPIKPYALLPLPGSRGTPTLILHPTLTSQNNHGFLNALSIAHGAGRAMSRAKALSQLPAKYNNKPHDFLRGDYTRIDSKGNKSAANTNASSGGDDVNADGGQINDSRAGRNVNGGTWVICEDKALVWEEAPEAYKDVWDVGDDLVAIGAVERVGWCWGRVSYKVRKE
ncbi:hypothetical protein MMC30_006570 [Trapelia coarctata]|nr:hypothetical protein [Trapelia coarctata]